MINTDPIRETEKIIKGVHDSAGKYTQPVLRRYPLLFAFLIIFSISAIMHSFNDLISRVGFFNRHPATLMALGIVALLLTGRLYKWLKKGSE
jgi:hypothetical protein